MLREEAGPVLPVGIKLHARGRAFVDDFGILQVEADP
jgi:hypothetical protein